MAKSTLKMVQIECTSNCNYNCRHCYANAGSDNFAEISASDINKIVLELEKEKVQKVSVSGGEPLLYPHLFKLLYYLHKKNIRITLDTNGSLLDFNYVKELKQFDLELVNVSLHGYYSETHDWLTQQSGSYFMAINALDLLASNGIPHGITCTVNKKNFDEIHKLVYIALVMKASVISFFRFLSVGRGKNNPVSMEISSTEHKKIFRKINNINKELNFIVNVLSEAPYAFWDEGEVASSCKAGKEVCVIMANGDIVPCTGLRSPEFICGNILKENLNSVWNFSNILTKLRKFQQNPGTYIEGHCLKCDYLRKCLGGCRAYSFARKGLIYASDTSCWTSSQSDTKQRQEG